ncbi:Heavy-metal-associated domain-containing protein [Alkalibacterium thalassium]|uniref:Heavy-metal-associated domain-containing protein n=2 Tax=Alkalibacterium thalassium TaxID=426701 RepID=A0A1G9DYP9_9LACT|nr:Heavy-metal-associated domain-containing protein [Alkalibacterium thalassium]
MMNEVNTSHKWLLEGIDCANCAAKIENGVAEIDGVMNSNVNYMTQTLSFDLVAEDDVKTLSSVKTKIKKLEPNITPLIKATGQEVGKDKVLQPEKTVRKQSHNKPDNWGIQLTIGRLILALTVLLIANFASVAPSLSFGLFVVAYLVAGYDVIWRAIRNLFNGQVFDENFLT